MRMRSVVFEPLIGLASGVLTGPHNGPSMISRDQITILILSIKSLGIKSLGMALFSIKSLGIFYAKHGSFYWRAFRA